jgi:hypothetical protein
LPVASSTREFPLRFDFRLWLNAVENSFSKLTRWRIRHGGFRSMVDVQSAINAYLTEHNTHPKPFVWIQSADAILAKLDRVPVLSECV